MNEQQNTVLENEPAISGSKSTYSISFVILIGCVFFVLGALFGLYFGKKYTIPTSVDKTEENTVITIDSDDGRSEKTAMIDVDEGSTVLESEDEKPNRVYVSQKYGFSFEYPNDEYRDGKLKYSYSVTEEDTAITVTEKIYRDDGTIDEFPDEYLVYKANESDQYDLENWWKENIKTEIGNHTVPDDYITRNDIPPFDGCVLLHEPDWQSPPTLEVTIKPEEKRENDVEWYQGSFYSFYDFGSPFILNYEVQSTGACSGKNSYLLFTSIKGL